MVNFRAEDNASMGIYRYTDGDGFTSYRNLNYVDNNGEYEDFIFSLYNGNIVDEIKNVLNTNYVGYVKSIKELPMIDDSVKSGIQNNISSDFAEEFIRYKTNREITAETLQFNLLSNENTIIWNEYLESLSWGIDVVQYDYRIRFNNYYVNRKYSKLDYDFYNDQGTFTMLYNEDEGVLELKITNATDYYGFVIFSSPKNTNVFKPILAYNGSSRSLYLRKAYKRPKNDYGSYGVATKGNVSILLTLEESHIYNMNIGHSFSETLNINVDFNSIATEVNLRLFLNTTETHTDNMNIGHSFSETLHINSIINGVAGRYINMNLNTTETHVDNMNAGVWF